MKQKVISYYGPADIVAHEINVAIDMGWLVKSVIKGNESAWLILLYKLC
jgi:hypothetical protein